MEKVCVSIIISCYNCEKYIEKCLDSILHDKINKEIIVINDGSSDNTLNILKKYKKKHTNIVVVNQKNMGQAKARNVGIERAKGKYISFVDSDDFVQEDMFYKMYMFAINNNYQYVYCDFYEHTNRKDKYISNKITNDLEKNKLLINCSPWAKLISKELIDKLNFRFPDFRMYEDDAIIPFIGANCKNAGYLNEALYYYNLDNMESLMREQKFNEKLKDVLYVSDYLYDLFNNNNLLPYFNEELKYIFSLNIMKCGVLQFAKYKEGIKYIKVLRKNIKEKFNHILKCKYLRRESNYSKFLLYCSLYLPPKLLFLLSKIKGRV